MSKSDMLDCEKTGRTFYIKLKNCKANNLDCINVPDKFHCKTFSELDTSVDDIDRPRNSMSQQEACLEKKDCEEKILIKSCPDEAEKKYINADYSIIYCSKQIGFHKKIVKQIREDAAKKLIYDSEKDIEIAINLNKNTRRLAAKALIPKLNSGIDLTNAELRQVLSIILDELRD